ncbi:PSD1 and planctomycete cytochrome C domain-containing protein [Rosistilla oblonga]|uniref:Planctomycete cytochrome C n=1 Tax=Rosistilla oblonga TaxID=2527990 RepID=A0A518IXE8_9BACT|nr:PSD1 and planctomycete cytochrome C domain-containing protein [Rosistilla oblonga]QDV57748.1 Planctomycete cytochrome C [Rosistilla oblonga]
MQASKLLLALTIVALCGQPAAAVDYLTDIKPMLETKCYSCHGVLKQEADLRLETRALMLESDSIVPGNAAESLLFERVCSPDDDRMPPPEDGAALKPAELALLKAWIDAGAIAPDEPTPVAPEQHWSFLTVEKPPIPKLSGTVSDSVIANPIDSFLQARREALQLQVQPPADRPLALRRLYLDLIGLPPTSEQLADERPWDQIVDELLASPEHAQRWARHWMDIWRYSDWYGLGVQLRNSQKHIWHWRDWIVESLQADKGYDQMVMEMLAGDELAPSDPDVLRATGFLARNYYLFNRTTWLDSTIEHTGKAFLGLTLNCAKCHDHKYDPITHVDYYRMRAIFEPHQVRLDPVPGETDFEKDGLPRVFDDHLQAETFLHLRGDPTKPDPDTEITPGVPALLASFAPPVEPVELPAWAYAPGSRDYVARDQLADAKQRIVAAEAELQAAEQKAAQLPKTPEPTSEADDETEYAAIEESFDALDPKRWELVGEGWRFEEGKLLQTISGRDSHFLHLQTPHPRDFDLTCQYTTTGGDTYKSVMFRFDDSADGKFNNYVYSSAHEPGPKVQVAYAREGKSNYPGAGRVSRQIAVGKEYKLRIAVRDTLINVWLDDEFLLATHLPERRESGRFSISGFDATLALNHLSLAPLAADTKLQAAKGKAPATPATIKQAVEIAAAKLQAARAAEASLTATIAADRLRFAEDAEEAATTAAASIAALRQAEDLQATAEYELLLAGEDANKRKAAEAKRAKAEKQRLAAEAGKGKYKSVRASQKALETPAHNDSYYGATYPSQSTGRRLALARWITDRKNPLTARVAVNHLWVRHFGTPLVESVFDFGLRAKPPEHLALLDYLAAELMESGWSMRHLHRMMVTSQTYQLSASTVDADATTLAADPTNAFYWRMNTRRMQAQTVRDSLLHLAGELDLTAGGPSVDPGPKSRRRSLYFKHSRDQQDKFLSMFDDADLLQCYLRNESIVPQQALAMANSELSLTMSEKIAQRIGDATSDPSLASFIDQAFLTLLARLPADPERQACADFCHQLVDRSTLESAAERDVRARQRLIHALLNHNDYISIR